MLAMEALLRLMITMSTTKMNRSYSELMRLETFEERYDYLKLSAKIGEKTFGYERYLNQIFYGTPEWKAFRREIIIRDNGCDLGLEGYDITDRIEVHHINPITIEMIEKNDPMLMDPENAICTSARTHKAIHYGDEKLLRKMEPTIRKPNDTSPWLNSKGDL